MGFARVHLFVPLLVIAAGLLSFGPGRGWELQGSVRVGPPAAVAGSGHDAAETRSVAGGDAPGWSVPSHVGAVGRPLRQGAFAHARVLKDIGVRDLAPL